MERWVWLEIDVTSDKRPFHTVRRYYVPEHIIGKIPSWKAQLDRRLTAIEGDEEPTIHDEKVRKLDPINRAIRFLVSGYITPPNAASATTCKATLKSLVHLYNLSIDLSIEDLELAIIGRIDDLEDEDFPLDVFLDFARAYYDSSGESAQDTSLGQSIKAKLADLLPRLEQSMTIEDISSEGGIRESSWSLCSWKTEPRSRPHRAPARRSRGSSPMTSELDCSTAKLLNHWMIICCAGRSK